jgi:hypothetical protein
VWNKPDAGASLFHCQGAQTIRARRNSHREPARVVSIYLHWKESINC